MGDKKEKPGFFKKFFDAITGQPSDSSPESGNGEKGRYAPKVKEPLDLRFVKKFTGNGGHFVYCESEESLLSSLQNIINEEAVSMVYSCEEPVFEWLKKAGISFSESTEESTAVCSQCEALIAYNGGIMIDDYQTGGKRLSELPSIHVVIGRTSQMEENLHGGMARINNKYKSNRPEKITTLKGPRDESVLQAALDHNANRTLYLLLLEDEAK